MLYIGMVFLGLSWLIYLAGGLFVFGLFLYGVFVLIFDSVFMGLAMIGGSMVGTFIVQIFAGLVRAGGNAVLGRAMRDDPTAKAMRGLGSE
jgi:hypothetical protein